MPPLPLPKMHMLDANLSAADEAAILSAIRPGLLSAATIRARHLLVLALALIALCLTYFDTLAAMVSIWGRSDTFAHGYLVAPISAWLIWRQRRQLQAVPVACSPLGVLAAIFAGLAWMLGELASVASLSQFALVALLIALVWAIMGTAMLRTCAFPLAFLFFLVPFGEFLFPTMMDWTTDFVVAAVRLSGLPVYVEGRSLIIPSGQWQVVEGCSGVRYLIASVVVGSLYAYLNYRSPMRRLVFTVFSVGLPVLANWVRAWGIVMIGHLSDNRLATGVDHLIYGWVFFGIIMSLLFWIGSYWQEQEAPMPSAAPGQMHIAHTNHVWILFALLAALMWRPLLDDFLPPVHQGTLRLAPLLPPVGWRQVEPDPLPQWSPSHAGMRARFRSVWTDGDRPVGLQIDYYRDQRPGEELVQTGNRVLISRDPVWKMSSQGSVEVQMSGRSTSMISTTIASASDRLLVWHGYWIGGRWTTNPYLAKVLLSLTRLRVEGDDSAIVTIYTPDVEGDRAGAAALLQRFLSRMGPAIDNMLMQTARP